VKAGFGYPWLPVPTLAVSTPDGYQLLMAINFKHLIEDIRMEKTDDDKY
jgi:hypothetical protein